VRQAALSLFGCAALDREHAAEFVLAENGRDLDPVHHAIAAGAADRSAGNLATLGIGMLDGYVFGVHVHQAPADPLEAFVYILTAQVGVAVS